MDFGDILEKWERQQGQKQVKPVDKDLLLDRQHKGASTGITPARLKKMKPQRYLDLHGCTVAEAEVQLNMFLQQAYRDRLIKVQIIHGKGYHSKDGTPVLKEVVYKLLERTPFTGEQGIPPRSDGGSGAVWVALKYSKHQ